MKKLGDLFSSTGKTEILRALHYQPDRVGLRQLTRIAGVRVRSAELALNSLVKAKLVKRMRVKNRVFFTMDRNNSRASILSAAFDAATFASIREESRTLSRKAGAILPFIRQAKHLLNKARGGHCDA